jgi:hypothetical protein
MDRLLGVCGTGRLSDSVLGASNFISRSPVSDLTTSPRLDIKAPHLRADEGQTLAAFLDTNAPAIRKNIGTELQALSIAQTSAIWPNGLSIWADRNDDAANVTEYSFAGGNDRQILF